MAQLVGTLTPRMALLKVFRDAQNQVIDRGLVLFFPRPNSYTGEDVIELQGHGGPVVLQLLLDRVLELGRDAGLRIARAGEFTERAFLNDKLDLAQAEAVASLIDAASVQAAQAAMRSLEGQFSERINALTERLTHLRMLIEATLDFPEEDIDFVRAADAQGKLAAIQAELDAVLRAAQQGAVLQDGLSVVLVGEPNVGKSSLLNALAGADVAIVTAVAGTTRDRVIQQIQIEGVPLQIVDTAGLRETDDEIERIGIERTWDAVSKADVLLHLVDQLEPLKLKPGERSSLTARFPTTIPVLTVVNKIDLLGLPAKRAANQVFLSAKSGDGVSLLREALLDLAGFRQTGETVYAARSRHLQALQTAGQHLAQARTQLSETALDLLAEELRLAQRALGEITGEFSADDLLGEIFSRFCIGK
jgi:tRNA modification GTPase